MIALCCIFAFITISSAETWVTLGEYDYAYNESVQIAFLGRDEALAACDYLNAELAVVNSQEINDLVLGLGFHQYTLIGLIRYGPGNDSFNWIDGTSVTDGSGYTNWNTAKGEPGDDLGNNEQCVIMVGRNGEWEDAACGGYRRWVCQRRNGLTTPTTTTTEGTTTTVTTEDITTTTTPARTTTEGTTTTTTTEDITTTTTKATADNIITSAITATEKEDTDSSSVSFPVTRLDETSTASTASTASSTSDVNPITGVPITPADDTTPPDETCCKKYDDLKTLHDDLKILFIIVTSISLGLILILVGIVIYLAYQKTYKDDKDDSDVDTLSRSQKSKSLESAKTNMSYMWNSLSYEQGQKLKRDIPRPSLVGTQSNHSYLNKAFPRRLYSEVELGSLAEESYPYTNHRETDHGEHNHMYAKLHMRR